MARKSRPNGMPVLARMASCRATERQEKALADYRARPFGHEARLKDLLAKQAQLNACLDLDKHEAQIVEEPGEPEEEAVSSAARRPPGSAPGVVLAAKLPAFV